MSISHNLKTFLVVSGIFSIISVCILIHKIDVFSDVRFLSSLKVLYVIFVLVVIMEIVWLWQQKNSLLYKFQSFLLSFLPSVLLFFIGVNFFDSSLHDIFSIAVGFYFIALGLLFIYQYHKKYAPPQGERSKQQFSKKNFAITIIFVLSAIALRLLFGLNDIGKAAYVDEKLWIYDRIEQYWDNMREGDWKNTRPSDKPGVTTALISGPGLFFFDPTDFEEGNTNKDQLTGLFSSLRTPQFLMVTFLIFLAFFLIKKLLGSSIALFATALIALSPLLLGLSRIINPDALLWIILFLCFLSFSLYLKKSTLVWIYMSGVFLGLALLTKYIANIFLVFSLAMIFIDLIFCKRDKMQFNKLLKDRITHYSIMLFTALSTFFILYPGTWVKHDRLLIATLQSEAFASTWIYFVLILLLLIVDTFFLKNHLLEKVISFLRVHKKWFAFSIMSIFLACIAITLVNTYAHMSLFDFPEIIESPKSAHNNFSWLALFLASFYPLVFGLTPLALIASLFAMSRIFTCKDWVQKDVVILQSIVFILLYYIASTLNNVVPIVRYQIVLYPFMILIASIGLYDLVRIFSQKHKTILWISGIIILIGTYQLILLHNFYFSYNSSLLPKDYIINSKDMGDGNYEIAQYLNNLPNAHMLLIWTDKRGVCQFFVGGCNNMIQDMDIVNIAPEIDYYIISQNRENYIERLTSEKLQRNPEYEIRLDRLYDETVPTAFTLHPSEREGHYIKVIESSTVNIIDQ
jgi:4-amino-4-deoxy-L-arabinose transferase-like glycosyltransferase